MEPSGPQDATLRIAAVTFEAIAAGRGLLTSAQVEECRALQLKLAELGLDLSLAEVLVRKGYLTAEQLAAVEAAIGQQSGQAIPGYVILEKIAEGGMGAVFKARQVSMDRIVALKVLLPQLAGDQEGRDRFLREARAVARLSHPNIVAGIDAGESHGVYYFVMEYLDGEPLTATLRRRGRLPWREAAAIVRQVALALEHAHRHGMVHRDVKPANMMLLGDGTVKLADLGLARPAAANEAGLTRTGTILGSPAYLSPEQAMGQPLDIRSDLFALGLTFFELVTGERAYPGENPMGVISGLLTRDVPLDRLSVAEAPAPVVAVIDRMTRRQPGRRQQDPTELLRALDALLGAGDERAAGTQAAATAESLTLRLDGGGAHRAPWWRRRREVAGAAAAALLLLAVGLIAARRGGGEPRPPGAAAASAPPSAGPHAPVRLPADAAGGLGLLAAMVLAQQRVPGGVVYQAELEGREFSIDLASGKASTNVLLDAASGQVLGSNLDDEDHSADVETCKVSLRAAVETALREVPGTPVNAMIVLRPGRAVVVVHVLRDGRVETVEVDGTSGQPRLVVETKAAGV